MKILITGGAGFIGSAVVRHCLGRTDIDVVVLDKMTYAASEDTLGFAAGNARFALERADICDAAAVRRILDEHRPDAIMHLAAETHVDRSIDEPAAFIQTNIVGTYRMLEEAFAYRQALTATQAERFRFHHVSTDEVYGSLGAEGLFTEDSPYRPNSPYSASKASADHLVRAWQRSFGLPVVVTNCSNNFGPFQFPEKLIPVIVLKAIAGLPIPIYGKGANVRDWLFVDDHAEALLAVLERGRIGETYNIGGGNEVPNIEIAGMLCRILDELCPRDGNRRYGDLIAFVQDRPGHDERYAIDGSKMATELGWRPRHGFEDALRRTVRWYLDNQDWCRGIMNGRYGGERLGLAHGGSG